MCNREELERLRSEIRSEKTAAVIYWCCMVVYATVISVYCLILLFGE